MQAWPGPLENHIIGHTCICLCFCFFCVCPYKWPSICLILSYGSFINDVTHATAHPPLLCPVTSFMNELLVPFPVLLSFQTDLLNLFPTLFGTSLKHHTIPNPTPKRTLFSKTCQFADSPKNFVENRQKISTKFQIWKKRPQ